MTEGVDVRPAVTVNFTGQVVPGKSRFAALVSNIVRLHHIMDCGPGVVGSGRGVDGKGQRNRPPGLNQARRGAYMLGRDIVQRSAFIIGTPSAPIAHILK